MLQHFPRTPAEKKSSVAPGILVTSSSYWSFSSPPLSPSPSPFPSPSTSGTHLLLPRCVSKEILCFSAKPEKIKSFTLRHLVSCSNTTCVEQAKLQFSCLLAIVGSLPNLNRFLSVSTAKLWANYSEICGLLLVLAIIMACRHWSLLTMLRFGKVPFNVFQ